MITYFVVPYSFQSLTTQNNAIVRLNEHLGGFMRRNKNVTPVSALFSVYKNPYSQGNIRDEAAYPICRTLIDSCDIVVVLRLPGWEYSDIVMNEIGYAIHAKKVIIYEDPDEQIVPADH
jgi:hypothetical protein